MRPLLVSTVAAAAFFATPASTQTSLPLGADSQGRPTAPVYINGKGPFPLAIDTAAQRTSLNLDLIAKLGLKPMPNGGGILHGATGMRQMNLYRLDAVALGAEERNGVIAIELGAGGETKTHAGVFGADAFSGKRLEFNYEKALLNVDAGGQPAPAGFEAIPAQLTLGTFAIVPVNIGGVSASALVDTGAQHSIANPRLMRALGYSDTDSRLSVRQTHAGATNQAAAMRSGGRADLSMGRAAFGQIDIAFADLPVFTPLGLADGPSIILGADVWRKMKAMAIDYERKELQLRP